EFVRNRVVVWNWLLEWKHELLGPGCFTSLIRNPINYLLAISASLFLVGFILDGNLPASRPSKMWPHPQITLYIAYLLFVARLVQWYFRGQGREWLRQQPQLVRTLLSWHLLPVLVWFIWPKRLAHCFWYLTRQHGA